MHLGKRICKLFYEPSIGKVVALELLILTNEFLKFPSAKKFACYAGLAPFEHSSGTSVSGKTRVSALGSRKAKTIFLCPPCLPPSAKEN